MTLHRIASALAVVVVSITACACGVKPGTPHRIDDAAVPYDLLDPSGRVAVPVEGDASVRICLYEDESLITVTRRTEDDDPPLVDIVRALAALSDQEAAQGLVTTLTTPIEVDDVARSAGVATVDLAADTALTGSADPLSAVAQVVCTLTLQPGIGRVSFSVGRTPIEVPTEDGTLTDDPVSRDDYGPLIRG